MASDVKKRMVEQMVVLLATNGLQRASFSKMLHAAGAPRGSLYHHFPGGKDQLVLAAMDQESERVLSLLDSFKGRPAGDVARAFIDARRALLKGDSPRRGCPVMAVALGTESPSLRGRAGEVFHAWRTGLSDALRMGGVAPDRANSLAASLIAACEGAAGVARAEGSLTPFDLMAAEQIALVEAAISA